MACDRGAVLKAQIACWRRHVRGRSHTGNAEQLKEHLRGHVTALVVVFPITAFQKRKISTISPLGDRRREAAGL